MVEQKRPSCYPDTRAIPGCLLCLLSLQPNPWLHWGDVRCRISGHHLPKCVQRTWGTCSSIRPWPRVFSTLEQSCSESGICACVIFKKRTDPIINPHALTYSSVKLYEKTGNRSARFSVGPSFGSHQGNRVATSVFSTEVLQLVLKIFFCTSQNISRQKNQLTEFFQRPQDIYIMVYVHGC